MIKLSLKDVYYVHSSVQIVHNVLEVNEAIIPFSVTTRGFLTHRYCNSIRKVVFKADNILGENSSKIGMQRVMFPFDTCLYTISVIIL